MAWRAIKATEVRLESCGGVCGPAETEGGDIEGRYRQKGLGGGAQAQGAAPGPMAGLDRRAQGFPGAPGGMPAILTILGAGALGEQGFV